MIDQLIAAYRAKNYRLFEADVKNYNLNIFGIRAASRVPNAFDDLMGQMWKYQCKWNLRTYPATTDPGLYWLEHPMNQLGTGILKPGQYLGCWQIGLHQGKYEALVQIKPMTVLRDDDKDKELDFDTTKEQTGLLGINGHRAAENGQSTEVGKWSAACQVLQNRQIINPDNQQVKVFEFDYFMHLNKLAAANFGNSFTYTLFEEKDIAWDF